MPDTDSTTTNSSNFSSWIHVVLVRASEKTCKCERHKATKFRELKLIHQTTSRGNIIQTPLTSIQIDLLSITIEA